MRRFVSPATTEKIRKFFTKREGEKITVTQVRDALRVDWLSAELALNALAKEGFLKRRLNRYWKKGVKDGAE